MGATDASTQPLGNVSIVVEFAGLCVYAGSRAFHFWSVSARHDPASLGNGEFNGGFDVRDFVGRVLCSNEPNDPLHKASGIFDRRHRLVVVSSMEGLTFAILVGAFSVATNLTIR